MANNATAIAALQTQVDNLPTPPDLAPYALASDLAAAEGLTAANTSSITALNTSLTTGLASKANQSALDALQLEVDGKSTPASVDTKLQAFSNTAAMNSAIASANNATLASVASNYALRTVTDQLALDLAAKQSGLDVDTKIANALLDRPTATDLTAAVNLKTTPADVDQRVTTALLTYVTQVALDAALALRDGRLDAAEASLATLQAAGFQTAAQVASAIATALLPYTDTANGTGRRAGAQGRQAGRPRCRHPRLAVCGPLCHVLRPDCRRNQPAEHDRRHPRAVGGPDHWRRQQLDQRPGLVG